MSKDTVQVPLDDHVRQIAETAGRAAAREVLEDHRTTCKIDDVVRDLWGRGPNDPGLKDHVASLRANQSVFRSVLRFVVAPVVAAIIAAAITAALVYRASSPPAAHAAPTQGVRP